MIPNSIINLIENNTSFRVDRAHSKISSDGLNKIYHIFHDDGKIALKMTNCNNYVEMSEEDYLFEMDLLQFLHKRHLAVTFPMSWNNGSFLLKHQFENAEYCCFLLSFVEGDISLDHTQKYYNFGKFIANLHLNMTDFSPKYKRFEWNFQKLLDIPTEQFRDYISQELQDEYTDLFRIKDWLKKELLKLNKNIPFGLIHGDVSIFNVRFTDDESFTLFDFEFTGYNYYGFDIAAMIGTENILLNIMMGEQVPTHLSESQKQFFAGYNSIRKITQNELKSLPLFELERFIFIIGIWSHIIHFRGTELEQGTDELKKDFFTKRIIELIPQLKIIYDKWLNNDLYYYNELVDKNK